MCGALAVNATCNISVTFSPKSTGPKNGMLSVTSAQGGSVSAALSGAGAVAGVTINPAMHDFSAVAVGAMSDAFTFNISNTSAVPVTMFTVAVNGTDFSAPASGNKCTGVASLNPGQSCSVDVVFKPSTGGSRSGTLIASAGGMTVSASLTGLGQTPAQLIANPTSATLTGVSARTVRR